MSDFMFKKKLIKPEIKTTNFEIKKFLRRKRE